MGKNQDWHREAQARYRDRHRETLRARGRAYSAAHRAESNARRRAAKVRDPQRYAAANYQYYLANRDAILARIERWRRENMEAKRAYVRNRRARLRGEPQPITAAEWQGVLALYRHRCAYCGSQGPLEQDHVEPVRRGGRHVVQNVVPACRSCNARKGTRGPLRPVALVLL